MNIETAKQVFSEAFKASDSVLMIGLHGIGKSDAVVDFCKEHNYHAEILFLSRMDTGDLLGIPVNTQTDNGFTMNWSQPDWIVNCTNAAWPLEFTKDDLVFHDKEFAQYCNKQHDSHKMTRTLLNTYYSTYYNKSSNVLHLTNQQNVSCNLSKHVVLFLDELSRAQLDTRQSALQLVLEKRVHNHYLPYVNGIPTMIIAADNPNDGNYQVEELDPALKDRFLTINVEADVKTWLKWAKQNNIYQAIIDYIESNKSKLHHVNEDLSGATPRSWAKLSNYLKNDISDELLYVIIKGKLGDGISADFFTYLKNYYKKITIKDIKMLLQKIPLDYVKQGEAIAELTTDLESVQKLNLITNTYNNINILMPLLHSLDVELLSGVLKDIKNNNNTLFVAIHTEDSKLGNVLLLKATKDIVMF